MKKRKQNKLLLLLLALPLLTGCGAERFTFPLLDGADAEIVEMRSGETLSAPAAVYTADGDMLRTPAGFAVTQPLYGVVLDPPGRSVMDVYALALDALEADEPVLVLYLDGFGWASYCAAAEAGVSPRLAELDAEPALALFPTITPVNYAGMVTGRPPMENGVTARGIHELRCESLFDAAAALGKHSFIAEGDTQILRFSVEQALNPDMDGDGDTDSEVLACALSAAQSGEYALLFVHFHGIDDVSHETGPDSQATLEKIAETDKMAGELLDSWTGRVIVAADHGQHENNGSGDAEYADKRGEHGAFAQSDIFVPLLTN